MKKISAYLTLSLLAGLAPAMAAMGPEKVSNTARLLVAVRALEASPGAAQGASVWKSTEEYNAYIAMANEKDAQKRISLAEAFLAKFTDSAPAVKSLAYAVLMNAYQQLGDTNKAVDAARKVLEIDANNLDALRYLSFVFPFVFKPDSTNASAELSRAESDARHGLEVLAKLAKPANVTDEQFNQAIKPVRDTFNNAVGFVALQRKDYPGAITSFKAALEDNPSDLYAAYRMGVAYLLSSPSDYNHGLWYLARAVALGKASNTSDTGGIEKYFNQAYVNYHGNEEGLADIIAQAATSPDPPADFQVAALKPPEKTGNPNVDNFNQVTFPLKLGGSRAEQAWSQLKGQPLGLGGFVNSVEKGEDAGTTIVRIALDQAKASKGYDIELKDSSQPKASDLGEGDPVRFQGTISAYTATPTFSLTLDDGKINDDDLESASQKAKTGPRRKKPGK